MSPYRNKHIHLFFAALIISCSWGGCHKPESTPLGHNPPLYPSYPIVETIGSKDVTAKSALCEGKCICYRSYCVITQLGICWSRSKLIEPTINDNKTSVTKATGTFTSTLTGLIPGTTYYFRAYVSDSIQTNYGLTQSFTTLLDL